MNNPHTQIDVTPFPSQQFPAPETRGKIDVVQLEHAAAPGLLEEGVEALWWKDFRLFLFQLWENTAPRWIRGDQPLFHGAVQGRRDHPVDVSDRLDAEALELAAGLRTLHPAALQQVLLHPLEIHCLQFLQRDLTEGGLDMVLDEALAGFAGRGSDL